MLRKLASRLKRLMQLWKDRLYASFDNESWQGFAIPHGFVLFGGDQLTGMGAMHGCFAPKGITPGADRPNAREIQRAASDIFSSSGETVLLSDVTVVAAMMIAIGLGIGMADAGRTRSASKAAADALATRFAGADAAGGIERRLDFAPRMWLGRSPSPPALLAIDAMQNGLGLVILRGLPSGTQLSAGLRLSPTEWAIAPGDLDNAVLTLPRDAGSDLSPRVEVVDAEGRPGLGFKVEIKHLAPGAATGGEPTGLISTLPPAIAGASPIRTGTVESAPPRTVGIEADPQANAPVAKAPRRARQASGDSRVPVRERRRVHLARERVPPLTAKEVVEKRNAQPAAAGQPLLPFKSLFSQYAPTAGPTGEAAANATESPAALAKPNLFMGIFPRSPMEEEAARR